MHDRAGLGGRLGEVAQRGCGRVGEHLEAQASGAVTADLDRDSDQHLLSALAPASEALFVAAEEELVDLDLALERLTLRGDHRAAQLLENQPPGFIPRQAELALELLGRDPRMVCGDQVRGPKPRPKWCPRAVHHRARRHRGLMPARRANPQVPARLAARPTTATARTDEPLRPARGKQKLAAGLLRGEALLELQDRPRVRRSRHPAKLRNHPDGANRIRTTDVEGLVDARRCGIELQFGPGSRCPLPDVALASWMVEPS